MNHVHESMYARTSDGTTGHTTSVTAGACIPTSTVQVHRPEPDSVGCWSIHNSFCSSGRGVARNAFEMGPPVDRKALCEASGDSRGERDQFDCSSERRLHPLVRCAQHGNR